MKSPANTPSKLNLFHQNLSRSLLGAGFAVLVVNITWLGLSPITQATCQRGCLTNFNTALGESALAGDTSGTNNTASGYDALFSNTTGSVNTAIGYNTLSSNTTGNDNTASGQQAL